MIDGLSRRSLVFLFGWAMDVLVRKTLMIRSGKSNIDGLWPGYSHVQMTDGVAGLDICLWAEESCINACSMSYWFLYFHHLQPLSQAST